MAEMKWKNCSKCGGEIRSCVYLGVELESCQNCGGFFLDSKLVHKIPALAQSDAVGIEKRADQSALDQATMVCPKCQCAMAKRITKKRKAIMLDVCPSCQGIWFDPGEYAKYCGVSGEKKSEKEEVYKVYLCCEACGVVLKRPEKEQNACDRCGHRLSLALRSVFTPPFWYRNHVCAAVLFIAGMVVIYCATFKIFGSAFQAFVLSFGVGLVGLIYIIRALIYSRVLCRRVDIDLDDPEDSELLY